MAGDEVPKRSDGGDIRRFLGGSPSAGRATAAAATRIAAACAPQGALPHAEHASLALYPAVPAATGGVPAASIGGDSAAAAAATGGAASRQHSPQRAPVGGLPISCTHTTCLSASTLVDLTLSSDSEDERVPPGIYGTAFAASAAEPTCGLPGPMSPAVPQATAAALAAPLSAAVSPGASVTGAAALQTVQELTRPSPPSLLAAFSTAGQGATGQCASSSAILPAGSIPGKPTSPSGSQKQPCAARDCSTSDRGTSDIDLTSEDKVRIPAHSPCHMRPEPLLGLRSPTVNVVRP